MQLPLEAPVMILPNAILFPHAMLPLYIFEPRYRQMLADALEGNRMFCIAMAKPSRRTETPVKVAGLGVIRACVRLPDGTSHLVLEGIRRVTLGKVVKRRPYRIQSIDVVPPAGEDDVVIDALIAKLRELVARRLQQGVHLSLSPDAPVPFPADKAELVDRLKEGVERFSQHLERLENAEHLVDIVSCALLTNAASRQKILETPDLVTRLRRVIRFLRADIAGQETFGEE